MEPFGLFQGTAQAVAQLAGVIKRHVVGYSVLYAHACSIDAKAQNASRAASQLKLLAEVPGLTNELLSQKLMELQDVESKLLSINQRLLTTSAVGTFLRAPVLLRELNDIDSNLKQLDLFFHMIGIMYSMNVSQRNEMRELVLTVVTTCLSVSGDIERQQQAIFELQSSLRLSESTRSLSSKVAQAEENFAMGLVDFQIGKGGIVRPHIAPEAMHSAIRYFRKACDLGKKEAHRYLGDIFYLGYGVECCFTTAVEIYEQGVARGDPASKFRLSTCYAHGHGVEIQIDTAMQLRANAADEGCAESMWADGHYKLHGIQMEPNYGAAFRLLQKSARLGVKASNADLALCFDRGIGVEHNPTASFELLREAFDAGNMFCIADLARCYDTGHGVAKNPEESVKLYEKCIRAGTWHAGFYKALYGLHLLRGIGIAKDEARGKAIILDAKSSGSAIAWYALGECYRNGYGWKRDTRKAQYFYEKAITCQQGNAGLVGSFEALGEMYETGEVGLVSAERSSAYYLRAANMLSAKGQWKAAIAYEQGLGQDVDLDRATHLFKMCANSGNEGAQRKTLAYYMKGHGLERSRVDARKMMRDAAKNGNMKAKFWLIREDLRDARVHFRRLTL